jgi:CheY-like chemotaxis protein
MARLLLVDDNPSIHKIAETLLGPSYVELVCVDSAEAALALVEAGETFDIALLDTTMPGMDGWELLARLRANPATSRIPVAMMAGVLDTVDPERLANAAIQGFLKKPIELRDLPDRVRKLLATPVSGTGTFPVPALPANLPEPVEMPEFVPTQRDLPDPSPFATQPPGTRLPDYSLAPDPSELETQPPGTKLSDLHGLAGLDPGDLVTLPPGTKLADLPGLSATATTPGLELDLLLLTPDDLLLEESAAPEPNLEPELEFEELDLDSLRGLPLEPGPGEVLAAEGSGPATLENEPFDLTPPSGWSPAVAQSAPTWEELPEVPVLTPPAAGFPMDLPELEPPAGGFEVVTGEVLGVPSAHPVPFEAAPVSSAPVPSMELPPIQTLDLDAGGVPSLEDWPAMEASEPSSHPMAAALAGSAFGAVAGGFAAPSPRAAEPTLPAPPLPAPPAPAPDLGDGPEAQLVKAVLANPVLMDALARAVVAQLGDQALREIAWEVLPELAEKLHRPS